MNCFATCSPNSAMIGPRSEKRLLLKSFPSSMAAATGIDAARKSVGTNLHATSVRKNKRTLYSSSCTVNREWFQEASGLVIEPHELAGVNSDPSKIVHQLDFFSYSKRSNFEITDLAR